MKISIKALKDAGFQVEKSADGLDVFPINPQQIHMDLSMTGLSGVQVSVIHEEVAVSVMRFQITNTFE